MSATETVEQASPPSVASGRFRRGLRVAAGVWRLSSRRNLGLIAAGVAFYGVLAIFPTMAAVIAIWGFVSDPALIEDQIEFLRAVVPEEAMGLIEDQLRALVSTNSSTLGWATVISLGAALWSTRAGVTALLGGLNAVYGLRMRSSVRHVLTAFAFTGALVAIALVALATIVVMPLLLGLFPPGPYARFVLEVLRWSLAIVVMLLGLGLMYRYGPNRSRHRVAWLSPGSVLALAVWAAASFGFSYYLSNFASYNEVYGSIGAVIALLMWLYISAYVLLVGAAVNAVVERMRAAQAV